MFGVAGLQPIPAPLYRSTQYGEDSASQEDLERVWNALDISPGLVAFPDEEATLLGLPPADRLPYDNTSGVYLLGAFHQIHCLVKFSDSIEEQSNLQNKQKSTFQYTTAKHFGRSTGFDYEHIVHCLDSLLQATICAADDFPWVQLPPPRLRQDSSVYQQVQQCKSWDGLLSWARKHSSCYRYENVTDEFGNFLPPHAIDRYRFCPEGSPYEQVVQEYFQSQGDAGNNDF